MISLVGYFFFAGILALTAGIIPGNTLTEQKVIAAMAILSRMSAVGCIALGYTYASELYPTVVRNNGFGIVSIAMRIGSMVAPQITLMVGTGPMKKLTMNAG